MLKTVTGNLLSGYPFFGPWVSIRRWTYVRYCRSVRLSDTKLSGLLSGYQYGVVSGLMFFSFYSEVGLKSNQIIREGADSQACGLGLDASVSPRCWYASASSRALKALVSDSVSPRLELSTPRSRFSTKKTPCG